MPDYKVKVLAGQSFASFDVIAGGDYTLDIIPQAGQSAGVITHKAVTVTPVNTPPTTIGIPDVVSLLDETTVINLFAAFADVETSDANMTYAVTNNSNPALFNNLIIDGVAGTLTLNYALLGSASLTVTGTDLGLPGIQPPDSVSTTFDVTIHPALSLITDFSITAGTDPDTQIVIHFTSPTGGISPPPTVNLRHNADFTTVQIDVVDGEEISGLTASTAYDLILTVVDNTIIGGVFVKNSNNFLYTTSGQGGNTQPTTSGIGNVSVTENAADTLIDLYAAFADVEDPDNALVYTVESNTNASLFTSTNIAGQTLTLDYPASGVGNSAITVRATDTGGLFVESSFLVTVAAAATAPSVLDFGQPTYTFSEQGSPLVTVPVIITGTGGATVGDSFTARTIGGGNGTPPPKEEAISGANYIGLISQSHVLTAGQTIENITIQLIDENGFNTGDPNKVVHVIIENLVSATGQFPNGEAFRTAIIDIQGFDAAGQQTNATLPSATLSINEEGDPVLLIDVAVAGGAAGSFEARTQGITAGHTVNYSGFSGVTHNITAGQTVEQLSIPIIDTDFGVGNTLTFNLFIENFVGIIAGAITQMVVTIDGSAATSNTQPTTSGIGNVSVTENAADTLIDLYAAFADVEDPDNALVYTVESNTNSSLFTSTNIAGQNLTLDYAATGTGTADIIVRATDTGGLFVETTFTVTVSAAGSGVSHTSNGTGQSVGKTIDNGGLVIAGDVLFFEGGGVTQLPANTTGTHEAGIDLAGTAFASTFKVTQEIAATLTVSGLARVAGKLLYNSTNNNWINWELIQTAGGTGRMRLNAVTNGVFGGNHDLTVTTQAALTDYTFNVTSGDIEVYVTSNPGSKAVLPAGERPASLGSKYYMLTVADYVDAVWGDCTFAAADALPMTITRNVSGSWAEGTTFSASVTVANYVGTPFLVTATMTADASGFYPVHWQCGTRMSTVDAATVSGVSFPSWNSSTDGTIAPITPVIHKQRQGASQTDFNR